MSGVLKLTFRSLFSFKQLKASTYHLFFPPCRLRHKALSYTHMETWIPLCHQTNRLSDITGLHKGQDLVLSTVNYHPALAD